MMNANDAKKVIDGLTNEPCVCSDDFIETNGYVIITKEHYDKCESALEKQTPKKPLNQTEEYNGTYGYCPCCNKPLYDFENFRRCNGCGQALDWS